MPARLRTRGMRRSARPARAPLLRPSVLPQPRGRALLARTAPPTPSCVPLGHRSAHAEGSQRHAAPSDRRTTQSEGRASPSFRHPRPNQRHATPHHRHARSSQRSVASAERCTLASDRHPKSPPSGAACPERHAARSSRRRLLHEQRDDLAPVLRARPGHRLHPEAPLARELHPVRPFGVTLGDACATGERE